MHIKGLVDVDGELKRLEKQVPLKMDAKSCFIFCCACRVTRCATRRLALFERPWRVCRRKWRPQIMRPKCRSACKKRILKR